MLFAIVHAILVIVEVLVCVLLIGVILLQKSRSHGAGMAFGAGMGESLFGAQAGNVLTRATVILGIVFLVNTVALALLQSKRGVRSVADRVKDVPAAAPSMPQPQAQPAAAPAAAPAWPAPVDVQPIPAQGTAPSAAPEASPESETPAAPSAGAAPAEPAGAPEGAPAAPAAVPAAPAASPAAAPAAK
jgi:preprotein translocase subunit SecG